MGCRASSHLPLPVLLLAVLALGGCSQPQPQAAAPAAPTAAPPGAVGAAPQAAPPAAAPVATATAAASAPAAAPVVAAPAAAPAGALASQDTNWPGIAADIVELRRRGNTLTVKLRLRNTGTKDVDPAVLWDKAYVMDAANAKKYEVLKDEKGAYIAALAASWNDRWHEDIKAGTSQILWAKFPAPPPDVKTVTLQLNDMPPFDELAIQDG